VVFEKCKDNKTAMLQACKTYYDQSSPSCDSADKTSIHYFFMDDSQDNCNAAEKLEIEAIHVKTNEVNNAEFNGTAVSNAFKTLNEKLASLSSTSEESQGQGMQPSN